MSKGVPLKGAKREKKRVLPRRVDRSRRVMRLSATGYRYGQAKGQEGGSRRVTVTEKENGKCV